MSIFKCLFLIFLLKVEIARLRCEKYLCEKIGVVDDSDCSYEQVKFMSKMAEGLLWEYVKLKITNKQLKAKLFLKRLKRSW